MHLSPMRKKCLLVQMLFFEWLDTTNRKIRENVRKWVEDGNSISFFFSRPWVDFQDARSLKKENRRKRERWREENP